LQNLLVLRSVAFFFLLVRRQENFIGQLLGLLLFLGRLFDLTQVKLQAINGLLLNFVFEFDLLLIFLEVLAVELGERRLLCVESRLLGSREVLRADRSENLVVTLGLSVPFQARVPALLS